MIITMRVIKELCKRRSGRTSEIQHWLYEFMTGKLSNKTIVVVCHNRIIVAEYVKFFKQLHSENVIKLEYNHSDYIKSGHNSNVIRFYVSEVDPSFHRLQGLKIYDMIFDTPEYEVFDQELMHEASIRLR